MRVRRLFSILLLAVLGVALYWWIEEGLQRSGSHLKSVMTHGQRDVRSLEKAMADVVGSLKPDAGSAEAEQFPAQKSENNLLGLMGETDTGRLLVEFLKAGNSSDQEKLERVLGENPARSLEVIGSVLRSADPSDTSREVLLSWVWLVPGEPDMKQTIWSESFLRSDVSAEQRCIAHRYLLESMVPDRVFQITSEMLQMTQDSDLREKVLLQFKSRFPHLAPTLEQAK